MSDLHARQECYAHSACSAVKKVKLSTDPAVAAKILREVTIWGRLSHPNIVRYHTSWVEADSLTTNVSTAIDLLTSESHTRSASNDATQEEDASNEDVSDRTNSSNGQIVDFSYGLEDMDFVSKGHEGRAMAKNSFAIHFGDENDPSSRGSPYRSRAESPATDHKAETLRQLPKQLHTLYIQMEVLYTQRYVTYVKDS